MSENYDVIIIGGGPNGLTAGAYLSKAGQKVVILEKRIEVGGGLATEEITLPDYFHNTHAVYHLMVDYAPPFKDFKSYMDEYNLTFARPELQFAMPQSDGRSLCLYTDVEKTCQSIAQFSKKDADSYREVSKRFGEITEVFMAPATYAPPIPAPLQAAKLEMTDIGKDITALSERTPEDIIDELFENDTVRTLMLYVVCHWGLDYDGSGVSYLVPLLLNRATNYRFCIGGSHRLSNAFLKIMFENQGQVRTSAQIKRIIIEGGAAKGVELTDGTTIMANTIISTIDTHQTFLDLVGESNLDSEFVEKIKIWQWEHWSLLHVHLALEEPPRFTNPDIDNAAVFVLGFDSSADLKKHFDAVRDGKLEDDSGFNCCFPSVHDSFQAPPGRASGLLSQMAPFNPNGAGPDKWLNMKFKEERAEILRATLAKYAPNMTKEKVLWQAITTPADIQNKFANMVQGSIKQGAYHPLQMGYLRPNEDCSDHRTPIKNLYLGGASSYPGGLVTFGPGYLTANAVADDLGIDKWWSEPEIVTASRERGLL